MSMTHNKIRHAKSNEISSEEWRKLREIAIVSETNDCPNRTEAEVGYFVDREHADYGIIAKINAYENRHKHPNLERGRRFLQNQRFGKSAFSLLARGPSSELSGMVYSANNTSGDVIARHYKRFFVPTKNYLWIGGLTLSPEHTESPRRRLRTKRYMLSKHLAKFALPEQAATIYPSPSEDHGFIKMLHSMGFKATDSGNESLGDVLEAAYRVNDMYGRDAEPATQVRMVQTAKRRLLYTNMQRDTPTIR